MKQVNEKSFIEILRIFVTELLCDPVPALLSLPIELTDKLVVF